MARVLLIVVLLLTVFWVYSIVDCTLQPPTRHRGVSKPIWILIVILLPVVGGILWFVIGRTRPATVQASRAPDDDPAFLGKLGTSDQDERIRRLEEELAALDAEDDDPRWHPQTGPVATDSITDSDTDSDSDSDSSGQRGTHS